MMIILLLQFDNFSIILYSIFRTEKQNTYQKEKQHGYQRDHQSAAREG